MSRILPAWLLVGCLASLATADDPSRVFPPDRKPTDRRLTVVRTLNDKDFFLKPPATLPEWQARRQAVREQLLVANGLWPLPAKTDLKPVIHGRIDRAGYSVEKVYFASLPGHYVSGNLYRPRTSDGQLPAGKLPGILCPHGHWRDGRLYDAGEKAAQAQIDKKAETNLAAARYPLQARCVQLARMGCVVFHYDMVGYADSQAIAHEAFNDVQAELRLQNLMSLQTWNSVRSLDFLLSLPEVDDRRIGVTGASGGGTQTFILCGIDDRPAAAFPAVMVSTEMQGGCVCENASYLRVGTGNVEFAALFAPKPLAMSGANDWTLHIERKGLPELQAIWKLYGQPDRVQARCWPEFEHNYNQPAREMMYNWFNQHLDLKQPTPIREKPFEPIPPAQLRVYDEKHPRPADSKNATALRAYLTEVADRQLAACRPDDAAGLQRYREMARPALRVMLGSTLPTNREIEIRSAQRKTEVPGVQIRALILGRRGQGEQVPALWVRGKSFNGTAVVWVDPVGKASLFTDGKIQPTAQQLLDRGCGILAVDVLGTGELALGKLPGVNPRFAGYTYGYNRPLIAQRAHDILTAIVAARQQPEVRQVHLLGRGSAGPWALLARGLAGSTVARTAADVNGFRFEALQSIADENMLPGAVKYGGLLALTALIAPDELLLHHLKGSDADWTVAAYKAADATAKLQRYDDRLDDAKIVEWLVR